MDEEKVVFTDDSLIDSALNVGAWMVQKAVMKVAPDVFRAHYWRNLEAGKYRYQKPRGMVRAKQVFVTYANNGGAVEALPGMESSIELGRYGDELHYVVTGGEIVLSMVPTVSVEDGLHILYVPTLGMADDDDDLDEDGLVTPLHMAVVLWAVKLLMPEGGEDNAKIDAEILSVLADIPTLYGHSDAGAELQIEGLGKELAGVSE
jgi:hypothetical protein